MNEYQLCKLAYMISQLITIKGILHGFSTGDRYNTESREMFTQAHKFAERADSPVYKNPFVAFQLSFLCNELGNKRNALIALEKIKMDNEKYNKKIERVNEILHDMCYEEKHEYRKLLYDTQTKNISGICNKENGYFQKIARRYFSLPKEERSNNKEKIKEYIARYAFTRGATQENAHDVICRNLYLTRHDKNGETKKTRLLFWILYCEETLSLYLNNTK